MTGFTGNVAIVKDASRINKELVYDANNLKHNFLQLCLSPLLYSAMLVGLFIIMLSKPRGTWALISQWASTHKIHSSD